MRRIVCVLEGQLARINHELTTNHEDLCHDQVLVDGDRLSVLDLIVLQQPAHALGISMMC